MESFGMTKRQVKQCKQAMYSLARIFGFEAFSAAGFYPASNLQKIVCQLLQLINECHKCICVILIAS